MDGIRKMNDEMDSSQLHWLDHTDYMYEFDISRDPKLLCATHILFLDYLFKADYLRWSRDTLRNLPGDNAGGHPTRVSPSGSASDGAGVGLVLGGSTSPSLSAPPASGSGLDVGRRDGDASPPLLGRLLIHFFF
eukprot:SAG11_NODE_4953_length_1711_cov_2.717742_3_plen_134_part_00